MDITDAILKELAEQLDMGMVCYVHKETGEVKSVIPEDARFGVEELWQDVLDELDENRDQYIKVEQMDSHSSFKIMEAFAQQVEDARIKDRLFYALERRKPFRNFRDEVDYHDGLREQWFAFKEKENRAWTQRQLERLLQQWDDDGDDGYAGEASSDSLS